jgi:hypothetical protein
MTREGIRCKFDEDRVIDYRRAHLHKQYFSLKSSLELFHSDVCKLNEVTKTIFIVYKFKNLSTVETKPTLWRIRNIPCADK